MKTKTFRLLIVNIPQNKRQDIEKFLYELVHRGLIEANNIHMRDDV